MLRIKTWSILGTALFAVDCAGGQTGDGSGRADTGNETGDDCEDVETPITDPSEPTALGFSVNDVLEFAEREFEAPIVWNDVSGVRYGPESGAGTLRLSLTSTGSAAFVVSHPRDQGGREPGPALGTSCPPNRLRLSVDVAVSTDGGALDESFDAKLEASVPYFASLVKQLDESALGGTFTIDSIDQPNATLEQFAVNATLSPAGMTGTLGGGIQAVHGSGPNSAVSFRGATFAVWPGSSACTTEYGAGTGIPVAIAHPALGLSGESALGLVTASMPVTLAWAGGGETELTLDGTPTGDGCLRQGWYPQGPATDAPAHVVYPIMLSAVSSDGKLDGEYTAELVTWPLEGDEHGVAFHVSLPLELSELGESGLSGVSVPSGTHRLAFGLSSQVVASQASGSVWLNGLTDPPCVTDPPESMPTPGGGAGSPGCTGTAVSELLRGTWGTSSP